MLDLENSSVETIKRLEEEASRLAALAEAADTHSDRMRLREEELECRQRAALLREALA